MRACEADRCEAGATVNGRWCERHGVIDDVLRPVIVVDHRDPSEDPIPEVGWAYKYGTVEAKIADATEMLDGWRAERVKILDTMRRTGMSLGDIAEVTGLTRQRIGQLLR